MWADALSFLTSHFLSFVHMCQRFTEISFKGRLFFSPFIHLPVLCFACFFHIILKKEKSKTGSLKLQGGKQKFSEVSFRTLARSKANTVIMVSKEGHSIASREITTSVWVRLGREKKQLSLIEEKLAKTVSVTPDLQWQRIRSKTQGVFPLLPSPMDAAHYSNKSSNCSFPLSPARSFVHPNSNYPLNWSGGVQVLQISTNCN